MTDFLKQLFIQTAVSSAKMSVIVILLLCLTIPVTKRYRAGWRYYSWLAVMLVFMIPFSMLGISFKAENRALTQNAVKTGEWIRAHTPMYEVTEENPFYWETDDGEPASPASEPTATYRRQIDITLILSIVWLIAAVIFFAEHIRRYIVFLSAVKRRSEPVEDGEILSALSEEKRRMGINAEIPARVSPVINTPMLTGVFRPLLLLPQSGFDFDELCLIFCHELTHYKRRDIWYQFIILIFLSLHWFNPFAYVMAKAAELDGETSCDEAVLDHRPYETRVFYGEMLLKFLRISNQKRSYMTTTFFGGKKDMSKRLTLIASKTVRKKGTAAMAALLTVTIGASVTAAAAQPWDEEMLKYFNDPTQELMDMVDENVARPQARAENNGTVVEIRQTIIDEHQFAVLFDVTAPEGTDLTGDTYPGFLSITCDPIGSDSKYCGGGGPRERISVEGNKAAYVYTGYLVDTESSLPETAASYEMRFSFNNIYRNIPGVKEEDNEPIAECTFDFPWEVQYTDISVDYAPEVPVTLSDGTRSTVKQIEISPLSAVVYLTNAGQTLNLSTDIAKAALHMKDGTDIILGSESDDNGMGLFRPENHSVILDGDADANLFMPILMIGRLFNRIIDVSECESVTIGGTTIRLDEMSPVNRVDINYDPIISDWARNDIKDAISRNIIGLYDGEGDFTQNVTRVNFCSYAYRVLVINKSMEEKDYFKIYENPYEDALSNEAIAFYHAGIMTGKGEKTFAPEDHLTREEAAAIIYRMMEYMKKPLDSTAAPEYEDADEISDWAKNAVAAVSAAGIMSGDGVKFDPKGEYTIEQAVATLLRLIEN